MGKKIMKTILALVMIVAGLAGFLWEFTVEENNFYTIVDTHYGNRIVCHKPFSGDLIGAVYGENMADVVQKMVAGGVEAWSGVMAGVIFRDGDRCVPGIEWLAEPVLPRGYTLADESYWGGDECGFSFRNELDGGRYAGEIWSCNPNSSRYQSFLKSFLSYSGDGKRYVIGNVLIIRESKSIAFMGAQNGMCYVGNMKVFRDETITDWQIMQFGMRYALPQSWEVTLLVLVNVLRGVCLATAVAGVVWLVAPMLKRKKPVPVQNS